MPKNHLINQNGQNRKDIYKGLIVDIVLKKDQASGILTRIIVDRILTSIQYHPRGIKVMGTNGMVGRVQYIIGDINKMILLSIGRKGNNITNYLSLEEEINNIKQYNINIYIKNRKLSFKDLDNEKENCMFNVLRNDRYYRMFNPQYEIPPMYTDFYILGDNIERIMFYEYRNNEFQLIYDFKSEELKKILI